MFNIFKKKRVGPTSSSHSFQEKLTPEATPVWIVEWYVLGDRIFKDHWHSNVKSKVFYLEDDAREFVRILKDALAFIGQKGEIECRQKLD